MVGSDERGSPRGNGGSFPLSRPASPLFPFSSSGADLSISSPPTLPSLNSATGSGQRTRPTMPVSAHACSSPLTSPCRGGSVLAPRHGRGGPAGAACARGAGIGRPRAHDRSITRLAAAARQNPPLFLAGLRRSIHRSPVTASPHLDPAATARASCSLVPPFLLFFFSLSSASSLPRPAPAPPVLACLLRLQPEYRWPC